MAILQTASTLLFLSPPVPIVSISDVTVADEGGTLVLVCLAANTLDAPGKLTFSWYLDNRLVENREGCASIVSTQEDTQRSAMSTFTLNNVMRMTGSFEGDGGTYLCEVTNRLPQDSQPASTNITVQCKWVWHTRYFYIVHRFRAVRADCSIDNSHSGTAL